MNLKVIHVVFVACSTLLAFLFGGWSLGRGTGAGSAAAGALAFAFGVGMIVYGFWFWRKIRTPEEERRRRLKRIHKVSVTLAVAWLLTGNGVASACEVCYGNAGGPMIDAARAGVFLLWGMVLVVQACLVAFFLVLRKRARERRKEPIPPWWSTLEPSVEEPIES